MPRKIGREVAIRARMVAKPIMELPRVADRGIASYRIIFIGMKRETPRPRAPAE